MDITKCPFLLMKGLSIKILNKLGLSWTKLSSNWNWNWVLLDLGFVSLSWLTKILLAILTAISKYLPLSIISSQNLFTSMPTYLHTSLLTCFLVCLLAFLLWLARQLLRLYELNNTTLLFTKSKFDLQLPRYDQNRIIIASHSISWRLAGG